MTVEDIIPDNTQKAIANRGSLAINAAAYANVTVYQYITRSGGKASTSEAAGPSTCPYPGLETFRTSEANYFAGREKDIVTLETKLASYDVCGVIAASGAGKSSLVHAGLIPTLAARENEIWDIFAFKPGQKPLYGLARSLSGVLADGDNLDAQLNEIRSYTEHLRKEPGRLLEYVEEIVRRRSDAADGRHHRVLFFIDQWEELYTRGNDEDRDILLRELLEANRQNLAKVLLTMRADFMAEMLTVRPEFFRTLEPGICFIEQMDEMGLRAAIEKPAQQVGLTIPEDLTTRLIADLGNDHGSLPYLQFVLRKLWEQRDRETNSLTTNAYERMAGLKGAIGSHAQRTFLKLKKDEQDLARLILPRLANVSDTGTPTSRRLPFADFDEPARALLRKLAEPERRLIILSSATEDVAEAEIVAEVAHEALLEDWKTLAGWIADRKDFFRLRNKLEADAKTWVENTRGSAFLTLKGTALSLAKELIHEAKIGEISSDLAEFVAENQKSDRRLKLGIGLTGIIALVASIGVTIYFANLNRDLSDSNTALAEQTQRATQAQERADADREAAERERNRAIDNQKLAEANLREANRQRDLLTVSASELLLENGETRAALAQLLEATNDFSDETVPDSVLITFERVLTRAAKLARLSASPNDSFVSDGEGRIYVSNWYDYLHLLSEGEKIIDVGSLPHSILIAVGPGMHSSEKIFAYSRSRGQLVFVRFPKERDREIIASVASEFAALDNHEWKIEFLRDSLAKVLLQETAGHPNEEGIKLVGFFLVSFETGIVSEYSSDEELESTLARKFSTPSVGVLEKVGDFEHFLASKCAENGPREIAYSRALQAVRRGLGRFVNVETCKWRKNSLAVVGVDHGANTTRRAFFFRFSPPTTNHHEEHEFVADKVGSLPLPSAEFLSDLDERFDISPILEEFGLVSAISSVGSDLWVIHNGNVKEIPMASEIRAVHALTNSRFVVELFPEVPEIGSHSIPRLVELNLDSSMLDAYQLYFDDFIPTVGQDRSANTKFVDTLCLKSEEISHGFTVTEDDYTEDFILSGNGLDSEVSVSKFLLEELDRGCVSPPSGPMSIYRAATPDRLFHIGSSGMKFSSFEIVPAVAGEIVSSDEVIGFYRTQKSIIRESFDGDAFSAEEVFRSSDRIFDAAISPSGKRLVIVTSDDTRVMTVMLYSIAAQRIWREIGQFYSSATVNFPEENFAEVFGDSGAPVRQFIFTLSQSRSLAKKLLENAP